jgi:hypothetical protein
MLTKMISQRRNGLTPNAVSRLDQNPALLANAIKRSLSPLPEDRYRTAAPLARQLAWATDPEIENAIHPPIGFFTRLIQLLPTTTILTIAVGISGLAATFIFFYNVTESVPVGFEKAFFWAQVGINAVVFPVGMIASAFICRIVSRTLKKTRKRMHVSKIETQKAVERSLILGHWGGLICASLWVIAGMMYPVVLTLLGAPMDGQGWIDFIGSHLLAGLITGAFSFVAATYCSIRYWQPILFLNYLRLPEIPDVSVRVNRLRKLLGFYQFVAVLIPMLSVALLTLWGNAQNIIALNVSSLAGVFGIIPLFVATQQIQKRLDVVQKMIEKTVS